MNRFHWGTLMGAFLYMIAHAGEPRSARQIGLAGVSAALPHDHSFIANPAGVATVSSSTVSLTLLPGLFGIPELRSTAACAVVPFSSVVLGAGVKRFGFDLYRETSFLAAGATRIDEHHAVGVAVELRRVAIQDYGSQTIPLVSVGMLLRLPGSLLVGGRTGNLLGVRIGHERVPRSLTAGISSVPLEGVLLSAEIEGDTRSAVTVRCGIEVRPVPFFTLRAGTAWDPSRWAIGGTISTRFSEFSYGGDLHPVLGWTHCIELAIAVQP